MPVPAPPAGGAELPVVTFRHHGLLGTVIEVRVRAVGDDEAATVDEVVVGEIERLQAVFNARDPASELRRWSRGEATASSELVTVVALAEVWVERSAGVFDPRVGRLVQCWADAAAAGRLPTPEQLTAEVAALAASRRRGDRDGLDLSAIAKGWIVDAACRAGIAVPGVGSVTVNAGGDLRHVGSGSIVVGIEDPHHAFDNAPPLVAVRLRDGALATSGGARRGWRIDGRWYPHVLDPRDGRPVDRVASASVVAADAVTADVVATICTVASPVESSALVASLDGVECLIVAQDGGQTRSAGWSALELRGAW